MKYIPSSNTRPFAAHSVFSWAISLAASHFLRVYRIFVIPVSLIAFLMWAIKGYRPYMLLPLIALLAAYFIFSQLSRSREVSHDYIEYSGKELRSFTLSGRRYFYATDIFNAIRICDHTSYRRLLAPLKEGVYKITNEDGVFLTQRGIEHLLSARADRHSIQVLRLLRWELRERCV